jgi:hypothetical protein
MKGIDLAIFCGGQLLKPLSIIRLTSGETQGMIRVPGKPLAGGWSLNYVRNFPWI